MVNSSSPVFSLIQHLQAHTISVINRLPCLLLPLHLTLTSSLIQLPFFLPDDITPTQSFTLIIIMSPLSVRGKQGEHLATDWQQLVPLTCWGTVQLCPWPALTTLWTALQTNGKGKLGVNDSLICKYWVCGWMFSDFFSLLMQNKPRVQEWYTHTQTCADAQQKLKSHQRALASLTKRI